MAYGDSPPLRQDSPAGNLRREALTPKTRRAERFSERRLVLGLDIAILGTFAAVQGDIAAVSYAFTTLLALMGAGVYGPRLRPRTADDVPRILAAVAVPVLLLSFVAPGERVLAIARTLPFVLFLLLVGRSMTYTAIGKARARGRLHERVLIVDAGANGLEMARLLLEHPAFGLEPVGFIDELALTELPVPLLGGIDDLSRQATLHGIDRVIVAGWEGEDRDLVPRLRECTERHVHVHVAPWLFQLGTAPTHTSSDWLWTTPLIRLPETPQQTAAWKIKRAADVALSLIALVLLAPVFAVLAVAIKLTSPGPVLFRQIRVTEGGREFQLLKFRSMPVNDSSENRWGAGEIRPTRLGRFMRSSSLDELPQLINIADGDMSLVGPRPERPFFIKKFAKEIPGYEDRLRVPAGLTGWAQVHGLRGETSIEERSTFDNEYIEYWSLWRDVVILVRTLKSIVAGEGR